MTKEIINRGSEWSKWDLHIHSPHTWLNNNYRQCTDDEFVGKIVSSGLAAIGLNNYFKFADNEICGKSSIKHKLEEQGITVFPVLEVRLGAKNNNDDLCDYHVLFSPNISEDELQRFMSRQKVYANGSVKTLADLSDDDCRSPKIYIDFTNLQDTINDEATGLRSKILCGFLSRGKGESRSSYMNDEICKKSDFLIHSSDSEYSLQKDHEFWTNDDSKPIKALFEGSDAHKLDDIGDKFTWVKAVPTFDGLTQVLCSPRERTSVNKNNPSETKMSEFIIDSISFGNDQVLYFNDGLNTIIGNRGQGKSILLRLLALQTDASSCSRVISESKLRSDQDFISNKFHTANVHWKDSDTNSSSEVQGNHRKVFYLPQGYLGKISYDGSDTDANSRDSFLLSLLRKSPSFSNAEQQANKLASSTYQQINTSIDELITKNDRLAQDKDALIELGNIKAQTKMRDSINDKINKLETVSEITKEDSQKYQRANETYRNLETEIALGKQDLSILEKFTPNKANIVINDPTINSLSAQTRESILSYASKNGSELLTNYIKDTAAKIKKSVQQKECEAEENRKVIEKLQPKFNKQKELSELIARKQELNKSINRTNELNKEIEELARGISSITKRILNLHKSFKADQEDIYKTVSIGEFDYISFQVAVDYKKDVMLDCIGQFVNSRLLSNASSESKEFIRADLDKCDKNCDYSQLEHLINDIVSGRLQLKNRASNRSQVLSGLLQNPYYVDFVSSIRTADGKTAFRDMTGGQKAIAILELIFKFDNCQYPILLDQPEDDIDIHGITESLSNFIKSQKRNRQIFIVSHSANLVLCSDSENIIVAENGNDFRYHEGAIEDEQIREDIVNILEGGEDALKLRMRKLGIPSKYRN